MPGLNCEKVEVFTLLVLTFNLTSEGLFGFFFCDICDIEPPLHLYFGLLPYRNKNGISCLSTLFY